MRPFVVQAPSEYRNVLVTGGAGFIGSHTALALLKQGSNVVVVDELNDYYDVSIKQDNLTLLREMAVKLGNRSLFAFYQVDICNRVEMRRIMLDHHIECILHLAARAGVRASIDQPEVYVHSNLLGSTTIFDLVRELKFVQHVVYASSSSVYGGNKTVPFSEQHQLLNVVSPYAATKLGTEALAMSYAHLSKVKFTGLRFFTVYGPRGRPDMAPFKFVDLIARGLPINQFGDGSSSRDYTYIDDIVYGILGSMGRSLLVDGQKELHTVYNLGNSTPHTLHEFISLIEQTVGKKAVINRMPMQAGDVDRTFADISKAKRDFGYQPQTSLSIGLHQLFEWYRQKYLHEEEDEEYEDTQQCLTEDSACSDV